MISTPRENKQRLKLSSKAVAVGNSWYSSDGMDPLAVYAIAKEARDWSAAETVQF